MADNELDPEDLEPVAKIRHAEMLIRREHRVLADDHLFWGGVAGYLNRAANIPSKTGSTPADRREFNQAQDIATGYIRMSTRLAAGKSPAADGDEGR
jgi:hypothetical protein